MQSREQDKLQEIRRRAVAAIALVLLVSGPLPAKTYHVDAVKGADAGRGTRERPFKTIAEASEVLEPGDKVAIHPGIYHEQIMRGRSGREGSPVVYEGIDRDTVILRGSVKVKDWEKEGPCWVKRGLTPYTHENSFVMVDESRLLTRAASPADLEENHFHLDPEGVYRIRLAYDADPNRDHEVEVYELDFAFNAGDEWGGTAKKWIVIRNMTIEKYGANAISTDARNPTDNSHWELDRLTVRYNAAEGVFHCLDDWYVHDCLFTRNGCHGCQLNGARIRFVRNTCSDNEWFGVNHDGGCGLLIGPDETAHSCVVKDNLFKDNGAPNGYGCGIYLEGRSHGNLIEGNVIVGGTASGIAFYGSSHNRVFNNVLKDIALGRDWIWAAAFVVDHSLEGLPTQSVANVVAHNTVSGCRSPVAAAAPKRAIGSGERNRFINNVFSGCLTLGPIPLEPVVSMEGNVLHSCPSREMTAVEWLRSRLGRSEGDFPSSRQSASETALKTVTDPGFVARDKGDFRLRSDSPLIDTGIHFPEVKRDAAGRPRPAGKAPDVGAYEYYHD
ncbi:MAG: right-handed parallel beta-helix repeat-containing protein [Desulfomonilaceae bacterium]|nr:right-handed parallel beta-helix repeat-containing protein [Desulfomonilaceae bacterium]